MFDQIYFQKIREKQSEAKAFRKKGDAMRRIGREETALQAYRTGDAALREALSILLPERERLAVPLSSEQKEALHELVETFGTRGGILQRLGALKEALMCYSEGATLEAQFGLPGVYNRLNEVKLFLLLGERQLRELELQLRGLVAHIKITMLTDKHLNDSGWAWADLGDCLALLGDFEGARRAYMSFIAKAEIKSPERTLDVLKTIASKLEESGDPDAPTLETAIRVLQDTLAVQ